MVWNILNPKDTTEAVVELMDGVLQALERLKKAKLENQARQQEIMRIMQINDHENQMFLFEREKKQLEIEGMRLELRIKKYQVFEYEFELVNKIINKVNVDAEEETKAMLFERIQRLVLELYNSTEHELMLRAPQNGEEKIMTIENG